MILILAAAAFSYICGGLSMYFGIRQWRKSLGYKPDPLEPENIYLI